ncbi:hypothetical protein Taro_010899 [Colocasia esculenta]|uniref:Putative plant transposon protein domain-containing protein n=1 Tax=Colocasia esculenta TaxID=4460 RepID=A0A843UB10_COLES|nr:hypothetical protein [Colocasia esculenta]
MAAPVIADSLGGYSAEFLTPEQQERFTFVKTKLCGNKEVDVANLMKNGMSSMVDLINQMQWTGVSTFSEVSYPDLVKAFFVCLRTEEDGSLVSSVKGTLIRIDPELLKMLFDVKTSGFSGVHTVDAQVKGLGIIGPGFKLRDGKLDINQLSAFNLLLHFIVCQILVPRSATFSSCTKADSDLMYWAIQNKEINMAVVMMERMKFARDQIWDTKSKLNVSLPYAHLITKIFKHFGVDLSGAVVEKMGQAIRSRNLKKIGFSVENGVWFKASVAEGEAIIVGTSVVHQEIGSADMIPELPVESVSAPAVGVAESSGPSIAEVQPETAVEEERVSVAASEFPEELAINFAERRIEDILPEDIVQVEDPLPSTIVASILSDIIDSIPSTSSAPENSGRIAEEAVASGHIDEQMEDIPVELEHPAVQGDSVMADAPIQGEQVSNEEDAPIEGELSKEGSAETTPVVDGQEERHKDSPNLDDREGEIARSSSSDDDQPPPAKEGNKKGKEVASEVPLLADTPFERQVKQKIVINLKPVIERLNVQGELLFSLQSDVNSIFLSQASANKELAQIRNAMKWFNKETSSMKGMLSDIIKAVGVQAPPPPADQEPEAAAAPAEAAVNVEGPSGPDDQVKGPPGPAEQGSGPSEPLESESVQKEAEESLAPKPPAPLSSPSHTPIPPTPPSAPTAPPAPQTFKKPQSRPISSPTPFQSTSSPASSTSIPSPSSVLEAPPASSAGASSSSSGPSLGPVDDLPTTSHSFLHPTPPPSFITIIPERAQLNSPFMLKIKDEFEEGILREYYQGHVSAEVLAPILSECERVTSSDWSKFYPLSAQQLFEINEAQVREGKPAISPATFLDMNSIHLFDDPFKVWEERYKVYVALHKALRDNHNHYPVTMDQFLTCASFGTRRFLKMSMDKNAYADLLYQHLDLHLKRMASTMGPSYSVSFGVFKTHFEEQEAQAWETISHFASILSPAFYLPVPPQS